jgi:SNF2 family DNA or RNA helicase
MIPIKFNPHPYQERAIAHLVSPKGGGLFLKPGLGKTSVVLAALKLLKTKKLVRKILILAPLRVAQLTWPDEINKWVDFSDFTYAVLHGSQKDEALRKDVDIHIINYEGLEWLDGKIQAGQAPRFDVLVVDESSRMRNTNGKRYKILKRLLPRFSRRYILTGSPQPKSLLNLFGQIYIADLGASLGKYLTHFRGEFFYQTPYDKYSFHPFPDSQARIFERIQHRIFHISDKDHLTLPPRTELDIVVEMDKEARAQYKTMEREYFSQLENGVILAANAAVASGKLRQICNGFVYTDSGAVHIHSAKLEAFEDLVNELQGETAIVVYQFEEDFERMNARCPGVKFTGAKNPEEISENWNVGKIGLLYIHPASAGYGLNLQAGGCNMIWFGATWNYEDYTQTVARIDRQGQTRPTSIYRLITKDTIEDGAMVKTLAEREEGQEKLFSHLRDYWENKRALATLEA